MLYSTRIKHFVKTQTMSYDFFGFIYLFMELKIRECEELKNEYNIMEIYIGNQGISFCAL